MGRIIAIGIVLSSWLFSPLATSSAQDRRLGWLSERYEVSTRGPETISLGKFKSKNSDNGQLVKNKDGDYQYIEDRGGPSYGTYQLASKAGIGGSSVEAFVQAYYADDFVEPESRAMKIPRALNPTTDKDRFDSKWTEVVRRDGDRFLNNEYKFIYETHYLPIARELKRLTGLDLDARGDALRNVIWSVAVQNGPPSDPRASAVQLLVEALKKWKREDLAVRPARGAKGGLKDEDLINAIYDERTRLRSDGKMAYFPKLDLTPRFKRERDDAIFARDREKAVEEAPDLNKTELGKFSKSVGIIAGPVRKKSPDLFVALGQTTFDQSGDNPTSTVKPANVPNAYSGVRVGRGYDLGRLSAEQAAKDLQAAGLSNGQVKALAGSAGLRGNQAKEYLKSFNYTRLSSEAKAMGLMGAEINKYTVDNNPSTPLTLAQQKKLFEISYARAADEARTNLFPDLDKYPAPAREAIVDMVFDRGAEEIGKIKKEFVDAARQRDWQAAAGLSKRNGAGVSRNNKVRELLDSLCRAEK